MVVAILEASLGALIVTAFPMYVQPVNAHTSGGHVLVLSHQTSKLLPGRLQEAVQSSGT